MWIGYSQNFVMYINSKDKSTLQYLICYNKYADTDQHPTFDLHLALQKYLKEY